VFVVALSCYDLWFLGKSMRVSDFDMLIRCFTFEGGSLTVSIDNETSTTEHFEGRVFKTRF
jgi:hypothetical protein